MSRILVIYLWLYSQPFVGPWPFFSFLILYTGGKTPWTEDQPVARPLPAHSTTQTQTSIPRVGFKPTTPVFERVKTAHALDRAPTVIGRILVTQWKCMRMKWVLWETLRSDAWLRRGIRSFLEHSLLYCPGLMEWKRARDTQEAWIPYGQVTWPHPHLNISRRHMQQLRPGFLTSAWGFC
jgi:hypothetical protein